jgi:hypothetical protein
MRDAIDGIFRENRLTKDFHTVLSQLRHFRLIFMEKKRGTVSVGFVLGTGNVNNFHKTNSILEKEFSYIMGGFFRQIGFVSRKLLSLEVLFSLIGHVGDEKCIILC